MKFTERRCRNRTERSYGRTLLVGSGGVWWGLFSKLSTRLHEALKVPHKACRTWSDLVGPWWGHFKAWWGLVDLFKIVHQTAPGP